MIEPECSFEEHGPRTSYWAKSTAHYHVYTLWNYNTGSYDIHVYETNKLVIFLELEHPELGSRPIKADGQVIRYVPASQLVEVELQ